MKMNNNNIYFVENQSKIIKNHMNEFVIIHNCNVLGYFKSINEAIKYTAKNNLDLGEFILKRCVSEKNDRQRFYSDRVSFA